MNFAKSFLLRLPLKTSTGLVQFSIFHNFYCLNFFLTQVELGALLKHFISGKFDCLVYEMLFIGDINPSLNTQSDSIRAKLFTWHFPIFN